MPGYLQATPALLPELVDAARREDPKLWQREDVLPYDARLEVMVGWGGDLYRLLPGYLEQPVAVVETLRMLANVIDPVLVEHLGFGLEDAVELVLRRVDHVASVLEPTWSIREESLDAAPFINREEFAAAATLLNLSEQVAASRHPERAQRALEHLSAGPADLLFESSGGVAPFGAVLAVRMSTEGLVPIPAGILVGSLCEMGEALAEKACRLDPGVEQRWNHKMERGVAYLLAGSGHPVFGPVRTSPGSPPHWAVVYSRRQVLVVDVVAGLGPQSFLERMQSSIESLDRVAPGTDMVSDSGAFPIAPDAQVFTLQVTAHPDKHLALEGHVSCHLRGFLWLVRTAAQCPEDLWYFLRDVAKMKELFSLDWVAAWELWRSTDKSFPLGGRPPPGFFIDPIWGEAEWSAAAESASVERALALLGFPKVSAWPIVDKTVDGWYLAERNRRIEYHVLPWPVPVAVSMVDFIDPSADRPNLWAFATGVLWKLKHMEGALQAAAQVAGLKALQVGFVRDHQVWLGQPLRVVQRNRQLIVLGWNSHLLQSVEDDSLAVEELTGRLISEVFDSPTAKRIFTDSWDDAPPGVRLDRMAVPHQASHLPEPIRSHRSQLAAVMHELGQHFVFSAVEPGNYGDDQAKKLENMVIYPWLIAQLHRVLEPYSADGLVAMALLQLEQANYKRIASFEGLATRRGFPVHVDPANDPPEEQRGAVFNLVKAISLILEEILAHSPGGNSQPEPFLWNEALSVAELAFASCLRSECLHLGLTSARITVNDQFEIAIDESPDPKDVDMRAYGQQWATETLPEPVPITTSTTRCAAPLPEDPRPIREVEPELAGIDRALQDNLGFGLDALTGVLFVACSWEVTPQEPFANTTVEEFAVDAANQVPAITLEESKRAIEWLTLRADDLRAETPEYWETERRSARVDTRPFVEYGPDLYVLPWTAWVTLRIISTYLEDGRLPWPRRLLPTGVKKALADYRGNKNDQLESDSLDALAGTGLEIRRNIKPHKAKRMYGLDSLSGEVDLLAVDADRSRIWVIEVKDPYIPFSHQQIRQSINRFHQPTGHVGKLKKKVQDITRNTSNVARALNIPEPERQWNTQGLIVTRRTHPAAFAVNNPVPFCTIDNLADRISTNHTTDGEYPKEEPPTS